MKSGLNHFSHILNVGGVNRRVRDGLRANVINIHECLNNSIYQPNLAGKSDWSDTCNFARLFLALLLAPPKSGEQEKWFSSLY